MDALIFSTNRDDARQRATSSRQVAAEQYGRLASSRLTAAELFGHRDGLVRIVAAAFAVIELRTPGLDATCRECSRPAVRVPWLCPTRTEVGVYLFSSSPRSLPRPVEWTGL